MKTIKLTKEITLSEIKKVVISNDFMGIKLVQSDDAAIHINAALYLRTESDAGEVGIDGFFTIKSNETAGIVSIEIDELRIEDEDYDLSHHSELTIAIPKHVQIEFETYNHYISAFAMHNNFEIRNENGPIKLEDCTGTFKIVNENGPVKLNNLNGSINIKEENGTVSADNLIGTKLKVKSENGAIKLRECKFDDVSITNENGMIYYESMYVDAGSLAIKNENGHINLSLSPQQGFSLEAEAELGQIKNSIMGQETTMFDTYKLEVGDLGLKISLKTENGMIKLNSSDKLGSDFFMGKLEYLKEMLKDNTEQGIKELHTILGQLLTSMSKLLEKVKDEDVREKIDKVVVLLKSWKSKINDSEIKDSLKDSFDSISHEVGTAVQEALSEAMDAMKSAKVKYKHEYKPHFDKHFDKGKEYFKHFKDMRVPPIPPFHFNETKPRKEAMLEAARMKILEMLEAGKITSEEAEKLLKAIH